MRIPISLLAVQTLILLASAALAEPTSDFSHSPPSRRVVTETCLIQGNSDLYGLGIRVGFYCQLIAACFANTFIPSEARGALTVNLWFQFGLFVGLIFQVTREGFYAVESYVVVILLSGLFATIFSYIWICYAISGGHRKQMFSIAAAITVIMFYSMLLGLYIYSAWFWWKGIDKMLVTPCGTYGFFLAKVHLFHWFRTFNKVFNIWMMFSFAVMLAQCVTVILNIEGPPVLRPRKPTESRILHSLDLILGPCEELGWLRSGEFVKKKKTGSKIGARWNRPVPEVNPLLPSDQMSAAELRKSFNLTKGRMAFYYCFGSLIGFAGIVVVIAAVENTLVWNQVEGVDDIGSAGQLIPLVVGVGSLLQVYKNIYLRARENRKRLRKGRRSFTALFMDYLAPDIDEDDDGIKLTPIVVAPLRYRPCPGR